MRTFDVFQQQPPIPRTVKGKDGKKQVDWELNLVLVGEVEAPNGAVAIEKAKQMPIFSYAQKNTLAHYPIVSPTRKLLALETL